MTTQAEDLAKALTAAAETYTKNLRLTSLEITTALGELTKAVNRSNGHQTRQDGPGTPRMPGRVATATEPLRGAQGATQPEWATATVVQDNEHDLWGRHGNEFTLLGDVAGAGSVLAADRLEENFGPLTVILDEHGNPATPSRLRAMKIAADYAEMTGDGDVDLILIDGRRVKITVVPDEDANGNPPEPQWSDVLATAANPAAVRDLINRLETAEHRVRQLQAEYVWLDADELDDLPRWATVLTPGPMDHGRVARKFGDGGWYVTGNRARFSAEDIAPARVLWTPEDNR